jgi:hypothetical protein
MAFLAVRAIKMRSGTFLQVVAVWIALTAPV